MTGCSFILYVCVCICGYITANNLDGVRLRGYTATAFMDSFEWLHGYKFLFGLHHVDFTNPDRPRTPKYSAHYYYNIIKDNGFPLPDDEKMLHGHFREDFMWSSASASYQVTYTFTAILLLLNTVLLALFSSF